jgi:hypothetical protein
MGERRTSAEPIIVDGIEWVCWRTGIERYEWRAEAIRACVGRRSGTTTYWAVVDGVNLPPRFRSQTNAMKAAIHQAKQPEDDE